MTSMSLQDSLSVRDESDLVAIRYLVRTFARIVGLGLVDETKLITAASELARNMLAYAGGGNVLIEQTSSSVAKGVRICFKDTGPGIADLNLALTDGFSTGNSLGLGLPGARRLVDEFEIHTAPGKGTQVIVTKWKR